MLITFEGPDGIGKTTSAKHFAMEWNIPYIPHPKTSLGQKRELSNMMMMFNTFLPFSQFFNFVSDRGILTALVYEEIFSKETYNLTFQMEMLKMIKTSNILIIYLQTDFDTLINNFKETKFVEELPEIISNIRKIFDVYESDILTVKETFPDKVVVLPALIDRVKQDYMLRELIREKNGNLFDYLYMRRQKK